MNLIAAAIIGIAIIVLLIAVCKVHPFLSLLAGSFAMAVCAGVEYDKAFDSFTSGVGSTIANVGLLIAFGSIIGTILFKCIKTTGHLLGVLGNRLFQVTTGRRHRTDKSNRTRCSIIQFHITGTAVEIGNDRR